MTLGLHLSEYSWVAAPDCFGAELARVARAADDFGFAYLAVADHLWQHPRLGGPRGPMLEGYITLAFLAAHTRRVKLLALATAAPFRPPALLA